MRTCGVIQASLIGTRQAVGYYIVLSRMTNYAGVGIPTSMMNMPNGTLNEEPPYAERHVRWCERSVNTKVGDKHL